MVLFIIHVFVDLVYYLFIYLSSIQAKHNVNIYFYRIVLFYVSDDLDHVPPLPLLQVITTNFNVLYIEAPGH